VKRTDSRQSSPIPGGEPGAARLWPGIGLWAVVCGALASGHVPGLATGFTLILVALGWGTIWELAIGTDWQGRREAGRIVAADEDRPQAKEASRALPYTRPGSPAARIGSAAARLRRAWQVDVWPVFRAEVLGLASALALLAVLLLLLPATLIPLYTAMAALAGLGLMWRRRQRLPLAATAVALVGLPWLAGHVALADLTLRSAAMAACFTLAAWGLLRVAAGGGVWLLNGGQVLGLALLVAGRETLAAGAMGILVVGQVALQPSASRGADGACLVRRTLPWLMAAMGVAALAVR
jgi:hypothetical protein